MINSLYNVKVVQLTFHLAEFWIW